MKHLVIPDCQVKPEHSVEYLNWIGNYIVEKKPDVVVCIGDFADMPSLSSYDVGTKSFEGRRYKADVEATHRAMETLLGPLRSFNNKAKKGHRERYTPNLVLTIGNHENRINKVINSDPKLDGTISIEDLKYEEFGWDVYKFLDVVVIDGIAYCFAFGERALKSDFTWTPVELLKEGDEIIAFDEDGPTKKYKTAKVEKVEYDRAQTYKVVNSHGGTTTVTADHLWLVRPFGTGYEWLRTDQLKPGHEILSPFQMWERSKDLEMAWLGGIIDGEGWLSKPNSKQGGIQIGIAQNDGIVFDKVCKILAENKYSFTVHRVKNNNKISINGSLNDKIKLLVETNAIRLLSKLSAEMFGRLQSTGNNSLVTEIIPVGEKNIVKIKTTSGTLFVNGQAHHNCHYFTSGVLGRPCTSAAAQLNKKHMSCVAGHQQGLQIATGHRADGTRLTSIIAGSCYLHDEDYMGPQGNKHWRGVLMLHEVNDGEFDLSPISLNFLKKKYS